MRFKTKLCINPKLYYIVFNGRCLQFDKFSNTYKLKISIDFITCSYAIQRKINLRSSQNNQSSAHSKATPAQTTITVLACESQSEGRTQKSRHTHDGGWWHTAENDLSLHAVHSINDLVGSEIV